MIVLPIIVGTTDPSRGLGLTIACAEAGATVIDVAACAGSLRRSCDAREPRVVLADHEVLDDPVRDVAALASGRRVLICVGRGQVDHRGLLAAGAAGLVCVRADPERVAEAVLRADAGETVIDGPLQGLAAAGWIGKKSDRVSSREATVLRAVGRGLTNAQIGAEMYISATTVKTHLRNVRDKLGTRSRSESYAVATRRGELG